MEVTTSGGVNVIEDFTRNGPFYFQALEQCKQNRQSVEGYWLESGELKSLYEERGWQVLYYDEAATTTKARDEQGNPYIQEAARLVAAKP